MSLAIGYIHSALPNPFLKSDLDTVLSSYSFTVTGTMGASDIDAGAVTSAKTKPGPHFYGAGTKSGSAGSEIYAVTLSPAATALTAGLWFYFNADAALTGATAQVNVNALGAKYIKKQNGADLQIGDILAGTILEVIYDGTNFQLLSVKARPDRVYGGVAAGTSDVLTITLSPVPANLAALTGTEIEFTMPASANTTNVTLNPNALGATAITKNGVVPLVAGDLAANQTVRILYDGTRFQLLTPPSTPTHLAAVGQSFRNLVITRGSVTQVTVTADALIVSNGLDGPGLLLQSVNVTAAITASGANGLDAGSEANAPYYIHVIYNPATSTAAGLLSLSRTAPTLPSGYTHWARVGFVANIAGDFWAFHQRNHRVDMAEAATIITPTGSWQPFDFGSYLPLDVETVYGYAGRSDAVDTRIQLAANAGGTLGLQTIAVAGNATGVGTSSLKGAGNFEVRSDSIYLYTNAATGTCYAVVTGYTWG